MNRFALIYFGLVLLGCQSSQKQLPANFSDHTKEIKQVPFPTVFNLAKLREIDLAIEQAIVERKAPGAVLRIERGGAVYQKSYGDKSLQPDRLPMKVDTIFQVVVSPMH